MNLYNLKKMIYELLLDVTQPENDDESINALQQAKINVSPAMAKNGVNIINNQTQNFIINRTVPKIIEMIKIIDAMEASQMTLPVKNTNIQKRIEDNPNVKKVIDVSNYKKKDPIESACQHLFQSRMEIKNVTALMKKKYVEYVYEQFDSTQEAAKSINLNYQTFIKILDLKGKRAKLLGR